MLNINNGRNKKLMEHCKIVRDYAILVEKIREYRRKYSDMEKTVTKAVDECIEKGVLKEFLLEHKSEVIEMCITEYDEEETMEILKRDYREEGRKEGCAEGEQKAIIDLTKDGILSKEQAAERLKISVEQLEEKILLQS